MCSVASPCVSWRSTAGPPGFSLGGSGTVVFMGAVWGATGGAVLEVSHTLLRNRPVWAAVVFWTASLGLTLRGMQLFEFAGLEYFLGLVLAYGVALQLGWARLRRRIAGTPGPETETGAT